MAEISQLQLNMMNRNVSEFERVQKERMHIEGLLEDQKSRAELISIDVAPDHSVKVNKHSFSKIPESDLAQLFSGQIPLKVHRNKGIGLNKEAETLCHVLNYLNSI